MCIELTSYSCPPCRGARKSTGWGGINKNTARGFKCARKLAQAQGAQTEVSKIFGDYGATEKSAEEKKRDFPRSYSQVIDIWFLRVVKRFWAVAGGGCGA